MKKLLVIPLIMILSACTSSVHMSQLSGNTNNATHAPSHIVKIEKKQHVIMGFVFDADYADEAHQALVEQCPKGASLVNTEYITNHGFMSWTNKIVIKAVCNA